MFVKPGPSPQDKTLVLLSGGMDSAVALHLAKANTCVKLYTLSFDYGQTHRIELDSAKRLAAHYKTNHRVFRVNLSALKAPMHAGFEGVPDFTVAPTWKPNRNAIFLTIAGAFAWKLGCTVIVGGWHATDQPGYPDCTPHFLQSMETTLQFGLAMPIAVWAPLLWTTKVGIWKLGRELGVPLETTWSCYFPTPEGQPCLACDACKRREEARSYYARNKAVK